MSLPYDGDALSGRIAVVAGATRGAGRGIAAALGEAGATVICTGRTSRLRNLHSDYDRSETIEETAELVTSLGGKGIAVPMDHLLANEVKTLAERLHNEFGKIDILVNDIWGAELLKGGPSSWNTPVWELDLEKGLRILRLAIDTHIITSKYLLPLLIEHPGGLLVEVTDGTTTYNASHYRISVYGCAACVGFANAALPFRAGDHSRVLTALPPVVRMWLRPSVTWSSKNHWGLRPKLGLSPNYSIDIHKQGIIIKRTLLPNTRAGPPVINGPVNQPGPNGIIVNVIHFLHEKSFSYVRRPQHILHILPMSQTTKNIF